MIIPDALDLPAGRLLCLDLGAVRIGIAACDELGLLASPRQAIHRRSTRAQDFSEIARLVVAERAIGILIGLPLGWEGEPGRQARWTRRYAGRLSGAVNVPVAFWDESYSTVDAQKMMRESGGHTAIDAAAAALILADFLTVRREHFQQAQENRCESSIS